MQEIIDLLNTLPSDIFIVTGSYAILQQDKNYRENTDIDILLVKEYYEFLSFKAEKLWFTVHINWDYELETMEIVKDWFKLHAILHDKLDRFTEIVTIWKLNFMKAEVIFEYKIQMLKQYKRWTPQFKKHLIDTGYYLTKQTDYFPKKQPDYSDMEIPF